MAAPVTPDIKKPAPLRKALESITGPWTWQNLFGWIKLILLILFIKGCLVDQYTIPTTSMDPTLNGDPRFFRGDRVLVNKSYFGARVPFTNTYLARWNKPERWDMVVFKTVEESSNNKILIKRIVGLPGETIGFKDGQLVVNGEVVPFPEHMPEGMYYLNRVGARKKIEQVRNEHEYYMLMGMLKQMRYGMAETPEEAERFNRIPEGHYMMLGDNTMNSHDSRMYGWVPFEHLYGRAFAIWWPWPRRRDFTGFSSTWWGMALLYGIPVALVLWEIWNQRQQKKAAREAGAGGGAA